MKNKRLFGAEYTTWFIMAGICIALLCSLSAQAQNLDSLTAVTVQRICAAAEFKQPDLRLPQDKPYNWKRGALTFGMGFVAGGAYGLHEMSVHHPQDLPSGWNRQFWDNSLSWRNKYRNGDPLQGPKFPLSTGPLVFVTDGKHLTGTIHRAALLGTGITIGFGERRPWYHYAADAVLGFAGYTIAFHSVYTYQMLGK